MLHWEGSGGIALERFAFVIHPLRQDDFSRKFKFLRGVPLPLLEGVFKRVPPFKASHITGVRSATGAEAEGWFIALTLTPQQLLESDWKFVLHRLVQAGELAERLGARIVGLGAFTKIAGDRGVSLAKRLSIPVTTGNSYTAATGIEGLLAGAERLGIPLQTASATVVGATGAIGKVSAHLLADQVGQLTLVARQQDRLETLAAELRGRGAEIAISTDPRQSVRAADLVVAVSSATDTIIEAEDLKPGSVICDVARPRNVSAQVGQSRDDVLVMDGGVIAVPGDVEFNLDFGFPPRMAEACIAETMILALEGRYESFTLGGEISVGQAREISGLAKKHGFKIAGFRRFERAISDEEIDRLRDRLKR